MSRFVVVGDATLDVTVAPSRPMRDGGDVPAIIRLGPGGQGANVAVRLARRGAEVSLVAHIGDDATGRLLREAVAAEGVTILGPSTGRSAAVVSMLDAAGERSMLSDRRPLPAAAVRPALAGAAWVHLSAYVLIDDAEGDAMAEVVAERGDGVRLSVAGGSIPPVAAVVSRVRARLGVARPDLVVGNRDEAAALLEGRPRLAREAAQDLAGLATVLVVTAGSEGSVASSGGSLLEVPATETGGVMLDATGSGDAYLAALIRHLAEQAWPPSRETLRQAMELAGRAGSLVARVLGAQARIEGEAVRGGAA